MSVFIFQKNSTFHILSMLLMILLSSTLIVANKMEADSVDIKEKSIIQREKEYNSIMKKQEKKEIGKSSNNIIVEGIIYDSKENPITQKSIRVPRDADFVRITQRKRKFRPSPLLCG